MVPFRVTLVLAIIHRVVPPLGTHRRSDEDLALIGDLARAPEPPSGPPPPSSGGLLPRLFDLRSLTRSR
jgi:hypothetical protein